MHLVDIAGWDKDESFSPYPEGSRDKYAVFAPEDCTARGVVAGHRYLVKFSNQRYPVQFWSEVIAVIVAKGLGVPVPDTFVAIDPESGAPASLTSWFYGEKVETKPVSASPLIRIALSLVEQLAGSHDVPSTHSLYVPGSSYMTRLIENYDLRKGKQHNFYHFSVWLNFFRTLGFDYWNYWAKIFTFDALIGNTDRHQDNWGVLWRRNPEGQMIPRYAPAFDNGTSLLHEITDANLPKFESTAEIDRYILRGTHHLRWRMEDARRLGHLEFIERFAEIRPAVKPTIVGMVGRDLSVAYEVIRKLTALNVPVPLTEQRADAIIRVVDRRVERLSETLS
jgi:hypothetical protein